MPKVPENISNNRGNNCLQKKKLWAIIVGINQYDDFEELKFCANDAVAFANTLQKVATQELPAIGAIFDEIQIILQGELLHTLQGHTEFLSDIAFSPDGKTIASASGDNSIKLWNLNGELIHTLQETEPLPVLLPNKVKETEKEPILLPETQSKPMPLKRIVEIEEL